MKINLIFFISEFNLGGAGNSIFKLCKNLSSEKYKISIICLNKCYYKNQLNKIGVKVFEVKSKRTAMAMFKIKKITMKLLKNNCKNIFASNIYYSNILSVFFLRNLNMKMILIERTPHQELSIYYNILDFVKKNFLKILIKFTFHRADNCVSNSHYISNEYNRIYKLNFETIYPPSFDGRIFKKNLKSSKNKIYFGTICRLSREKNLSSLIKILSNFKNNFFLEIIGEGPEKEKLVSLRKKLHLEKQIKFTGKVSPDKIKTHFKKFDFYLNSSDFEGFPNTAVEALSHNVPVIASQSHGGINEILKGKKFGYIYRDQYELQKILKNIFSRKIKFTFNQSQLFKHLNQFSETNNLKKYNNLFKKVK